MAWFMPLRSPLAAMILAFLPAVSAGCFLYGDGDCLYGGYGADEAAIYDPGLRNPYTGECEYFGWTGCALPEGCGPCAAGGAEADRAQPPSWGECESHCTGLDEDTCIDTSACRAIYAGDVYHACWSTDQSGPIQGGGCEGLDAFACSQHDDCSAVHAWHEIPPAGADADLEAPEPGFTSTVGEFERCIPEKGQCQGGGCGDPGSCDGEVACDALPPDCPSGTTPGISGLCWTGYCIPLVDCGDGDPDPGRCYEAVGSGQVAPDCPAGTTPGIARGHYTGFCIPLDRCEAAPECGGIQAEATCIAREDCTALYHGVDCECVGDACTCAEWIYASCE
jgi:hypothetical protein